MATQPRFRFDFADLRPKPAELHVLPPAVVELPSGAARVPPQTRPGWVPALPAFLAEAEPLHVAVVGPGAFPGLLLRSLAGLLAAAGGEAGCEVWTWAGGLAAGAAGFDRLPARPHVTLVGADLSREEVAAAGSLLGAAPPPAWLVLARDLPALDGVLGLSAGAIAEQCRGGPWRLAELDRSELFELAHGRSPALGQGRFARRCQALAGGALRAYRGALA